MSTEGIPTPRTDKRDGAAGVSGDFCRQLERELHCANQKLQAIRELVEKAQALNLDLLPLNSFTKILNS